MTDAILTMLAVGDIILSRPEPDSYFSFVAPLLKSADIVVGQGEIPFTDKPVFSAARSAIAAPTINYEVCPSENVKALKNAGIPNKMKECFPYAPAPDESKQTIIAKCVIENKKIVRVSYLPCLINDSWQPEILKHDEWGQKVFDYMDMITGEAELNAKYKWDGDEVVIFTS